MRPPNCATLKASIPWRQNVTDRLLLALVGIGVHPIAAAGAIAWLARHDGWRIADSNRSMNRTDYGSYYAALRSLRQRVRGFASDSDFVVWLSGQPCRAWRAASVDCSRQWNPQFESFKQFVKDCGSDVVVTYRVERDALTASPQVFAWMASVMPNFLGQRSLLLKN